MDDNMEEDQQSQIRSFVLQRRKRKSDLPYEDIETEGERQLKALARKQVDTDVTLQGELRKKKEFSRSQVFEPLSASVSGPLSLQTYQNLAEQDARVEELRSYGLDQDEIELKMASETADQQTGGSKKSKYGTDPLAVEARLEIIEEKIQDKITQLEKESLNKFQGAKVMSRHEMDLEKAITRDRENTDFLKILITDKKPEGKSDDQTRSEVKQMLDVIETRLKGKSMSGDQNSEDSEEDGTNLPLDIDPGNKDLYTSTGCDDCDKLRMMDRYFVGPLLKTEYDYYEKCDTCKQLKYRLEDEMKNKVNEKTNVETKNESKKVKKCVKNAKEDNKPVEISDNVVAIPVDVIKKYCLTVEQIKELPRFKEYDPGPPSKVLYLKNLSNKVTIEDLMTLFVHFQQAGDNGRISVKLLTGRMKGQAFVYFTDEEKAQEALNLVNGYDFRGKPIVVQFGKKG